MVSSPSADPLLITTTQELATLCKRLAEFPYITVDTEFMRERTYWPVLCLIQVAGKDEAALIDPLAPGMDLTPLLDLMAMPEMTKVFHAGRQDLDIFFQLAGTFPVNVADTQIMAMALGYGDAISYENLVREVLKTNIDKGARFTDWSQRPLTSRQLHYAQSDVTHLLIAYERLREQLIVRNRMDWIAEEMAALTNPANYQIEPAEAWRRLKIRSDKPRFLAVLKEIAAWREQEAKERNLPRQRILKDDALLELASHPPDSRQAFEKHRSLPQGYGAGSLGKGLFGAIEKGLALPKDQIPRLPPRPEGEKPGPEAELLRVLVKHICHAQEVAPKLLASAYDLDQLARMKEKADISLLRGWRYDICGRQALDLLDRRIGLSVGKEGIALVPLTELRP